MNKIWRALSFKIILVVIDSLLRFALDNMWGNSNGSLLSAALNKTDLKNANLLSNFEVIAIFLA